MLAAARPRVAVRPRAGRGRQIHLLPLGGAAEPRPARRCSHPVPAPEEFGEPVPAGLRARLPLLVPLRDFCTGMDCGRGRRSWHRSDLEQALAVWVDRLPPPGLSGALVRDHLHGRQRLPAAGRPRRGAASRRPGTAPRSIPASCCSAAGRRPARWQEAGNRILLTSRPYGLDEAGLGRLGLRAPPLEPLPEPLQDLFVTRWFHTLGKPELIAGLIETIRGRDDLAPLAENPMLLTAVCVLYDRAAGCPRTATNSTRASSTPCCISRYPGDAREREPVCAPGGDRPRHAHGRAGRRAAADACRRDQLGRDRAYACRLRRAQPRLWARRGRGRTPARGASDPLRPAGAAAERACRLLSPELSGVPGGRSESPAAARRRLEQVFRERGTVPEWRPTLLFLFAAQIFNKDARVGPRAAHASDRGPGAAPRSRPTRHRGLHRRGARAVPGQGLSDTRGLAEGFRQFALYAIEDEIEVQDRQTLGLCLGRLGDPRIFDLRDPEAYVEVPAGIYPYGETERPSR